MGSIPYFFSRVERRIAAPREQVGFWLGIHPIFTGRVGE